LSEDSQNIYVVHQAESCQLLVVSEAYKFFQLEIFVPEKLGSYSDSGESIRICGVHAEVLDGAEGLVNLVRSMLEKAIRVLILHKFVIFIVIEQIIVKFIVI
jgi:hypothetical protein